MTGMTYLVKGWMDGWMNGWLDGWMIEPDLKSQNSWKRPLFPSRHRLHEHILKLLLAKTLQWIKVFDPIFLVFPGPLPSVYLSHWCPKPLAGSSLELSWGVRPSLPKTSWERKSHDWILAPEHPFSNYMVPDRHK